MSHGRQEETTHESNSGLNCHVQDLHREAIRDIWLWDFSRVVGNERKVIDFLKLWNIKRAYVQIGSSLEALKKFLRIASGKGIEVFALDGQPEYVNDHRILLERLNNVIEFNRMNGAIRFRGFQIDVEPYILKDFNINREQYIKEYIELIKTPTKTDKRRRCPVEYHPILV